MMPRQHKSWVRAAASESIEYFTIDYRSSMEPRLPLGRLPAAMIHRASGKRARRVPAMQRSNFPRYC